MVKFEILIVSIFLIGFISASCNSTQININTASSTELDKIINVGPATAIKIIANRSYGSVDDLIRVKGIGNLTLTEIKSQGLACVEGTEDLIKEKENTSSSQEEISQTNSSQNDEATEEDEKQTSTSISGEVSLTKTTNNYYTSSNKTEKVETTELFPISLNSNSTLSESKDIKTENNKEIWKRNLPFYGLIAFCVVFGSAFLLRRRKNKHGFE
jgi:hypothetical protein